MNPKRIAVFVAAWGCLALAGWAAQGAEESVASLVGKLKSSEESAKLQAIDALAAQGDKAAAAVAPLTALLKDPSAAVRAHAASALGDIGEPAKATVPALAELVKDPDEGVREQAIESIAQLHPGPQVMVPLCAKLLEDDDPGVRMRVLQAIADRGEQAVPGLIAGLKNEKVAYWACLVLREIGPAAKAAVPALTETLADKRPEVRREAILALAAMGDAATPAVKAIAAALNDQDTDEAATFALARIGKIPADAEARIKANAKGNDKFLGTLSLWALVTAHPEDKQLRREAGEKLVERLKDKDATVRTSAARALVAMSPAPEIMLPIWEKAFQNADEATVVNALDAWAQLGAPAIPRLIEALKYESIRGQVVYIIGQIGPAAAPATDALAKLLQDKDDRVVHEAALALAKIGPAAKAAVPALVKAIGAADAANAPAMAYALGRIGPDASAAVPALTGLLKSSEKKLAMTSAWALVKIGPSSAELAKKVVPLLSEGLADELPVVRQGSAEALGSLGPLAKAALPALKKAAGDANEGVRKTAAEAAKKIEGK